MTQDEITYNVPLKIFDNPAPSILIFNGGSVEVMRISAEGVTVNPDISVDEAAKYVIAALDSHIKHLLAHEREACAKLFDDRDNGIGFYEPHEPAEIIRARGKA